MLIYVQEEGIASTRLEHLAWLEMIHTMQSYKNNCTMTLNRQIRKPFHRSCISTYTSSHHTKRYLRCRNSNQSSISAPPTKLKLAQRLFAKRLQKCRKKEVLLEIYDKRDDQLAAEVRVRINGANAACQKGEKKIHLVLH